MHAGVRWGLALSTGVAAFALAGCDGGLRSPSFEPAGSAGAEDSGVDAAGAAGATGALADEGVPLALSGGRITNSELGIEGAVFADSDPYTAVGMTSNLTVPVDPAVGDACITGTAAMVDQWCNAPDNDCFALYWGAAIGMILNQPEGDTKPLPYDASALQGFAFEIAGATLPAPKDLRITVEAEAGEFCNVRTVKIVAGTNRILLSQLVDRCFRPTDDPPNPSAETAQSKLLKLSWHVLTNTESTVPFDFCVSNVRALLK